MAMEVSCGQCQGRLLVETLGVVVACPHCGVHLSIPAPDPIPAPAPVILVEPPQATAPEPLSPTPPIEQPPTTPSVPSVMDASQPRESTAPTLPEFTQMSPQDFAAFAVTGASLAPKDSAQDDQHSASVFGGPDEHSSNPAQVGWASAPNLFLSPDYSSPPPDTSIAPAVDFANPQSIPEANLQSPAVLPSRSADIAAVGATAPVRAAWTFNAAPTEEPPSVLSEPAAEAFKFSAPGLLPSEPENADFPASQIGIQFTPAPASAAPIFQAPPAPEPANRLVFTPAPVTAPTIPAPGPVHVFGAAPASGSTIVPSAPVPTSPAPTAPAPSPFVFGAAPSPAPVALPNHQPAGNESLNDSLPSTTVAEEAATYAENEFQDRQKLLMMMLIIVASYASAVSIVLVYLLVWGGTNSLESLPDLIPPKKPRSDEIGWYYNPPKVDVAPWHVLALDQSRRFGNVKVTPIKVTRGPVQFEHFTGRPENNRSPSGSVLKLWVKFENVSRDQTFAPLDSHLLFTRRSLNVGQVIQANSFVATEAERKKGKLSSFLFDMSVESEFRMVGQKLGQELAPGDTLVTYIPSDEEATSLNGDMVWRFQIRKGYNRKSYRGVTTLIDVRFNSKNITEDARS